METNYGMGPSFPRFQHIAGPRKLPIDGEFPRVKTTQGCASETLVPAGPTGSREDVAPSLVKSVLRTVATLLSLRKATKGLV